MRVLALIEAQVVTSPARIVLRFAVSMRDTVDLRLATFVREQSATNPLIEAAREAQVPVSIIPEARRFDFGAVSGLKQLCREFVPDLLESNSIKSHFLVSLLRNRRFGWLAFHHGYTDEDLKMRIYNQLDRFSLRGADRVVTVCQPFAHELAGIGVPADRIVVIPNGIPADYLPPDERAREEGRRRFGIAPGEQVIFTAGRLSPEKGHRFLIEAAALLRSGRAPSFRVLIAGSGLLAETLAGQIRAAGLDSTVQLLGHVPDVRPLFQMADLFVLPSLSEGSPMVLLESMAAGVPIVTSDVGGIPEMLTNEQTALLVPPANPEALAAALGSLLADPGRARRLAAAASDHVRKDFSPELYNRRVLEAFTAVLQAREGPRPQRIAARS